MRNVVLCFLLAVWLPGSSTGTSGGPANVVARSLSEEHVARPQADLELRCNSADFLGPNLLVGEGICAFIFLLGAPYGKAVFAGLVLDALQTCATVCWF